MPPSQSRRSASEAGLRKSKRKEGIDLKRAKGIIACAECRRLKLRCDRNVPCVSCIRRGCHTICPNGVLASGQGSRFILADTDELHRKITDMGNRIRQLEDALANVQATISREPHPLLRPELLEMKHGVSSVTTNHSELSNDCSDELDKGILRSFNDLTIKEGGASGEALYLPIIDIDESTRTKESIRIASSQQTLPGQIKQLSSDFPFSPLYLPKDELQGAIEARLPSYERATALCELYVQHASWWVRPIGREQLMEELMPTAYKQQRGRSLTRSSMQEEGSLNTRMDPHDLAALLMLFAVAASGDFTLEPSSPEAETYFHLSRAALCLRPILDAPSATAVQTLCLMGTFDMVSYRARSLDGAYKIISLAMTLGTSIGLHRDPTHWNFEPKMIQRRRELFWELRYFDAWKSIASGRPVGVHPDDVDCGLPIDTDTTLDEKGNEIPSFWRWKNLFLRDVFLPMVHRLTSAKPLKYSEILELDGKIREFGPRSPARQIIKAIGNECYSGVDGVRAYIQKYMLSMWKDMCMQLLHRNFFARALLENPKNPMQSTFAPSFLSCYNSAISLLRVIREHYHTMSHVMVRYWSTWAHSLISAITLGSVAARAPSSELAPRAYVDLVLSIRIFLRARIHPALQIALPVILRLREKAHQALLEAGKDPDKLMRELGPALVSHNGFEDAQQSPDGRQGDAGPAKSITSDSQLTAGTSPTPSQGGRVETGTREGSTMSNDRSNRLEMSSTSLTAVSLSNSEESVWNLASTGQNASGFAERATRGEQLMQDICGSGLSSSMDFTITPGVNTGLPPNIDSVNAPQPQVPTSVFEFDTLFSDPFHAPQSQLHPQPFSYPVSASFGALPAIPIAVTDPAGDSSANGSACPGFINNAFRSSFNRVQEPDFAALLSMSLGGATPPSQALGDTTNGQIPIFMEADQPSMDFDQIERMIFEVAGSSSGVGYTSISSANDNAGSYDEELLSGREALEMMLRACPC